MITSFNFPSAENAGGVYMLEFIPTYNIARFPAIVNNKAQSAIILPIGILWNKGYFTIGTGIAGSPEELTDAGLVHANGFAGIMPKVTDAIHQLFTEMANTPFVTKYKDRNGTTMIQGSIESPMYFRFGFAHGGKIKDRNSYAYQFYNNSKNPAVIYPF